MNGMLTLASQDLAGLSGSVNSIEQAGGIGGLLSVLDTNGANPDLKYVYCHDANGNVVQMLDCAAANVSAAMVAKYEYDGYGNVTASGGTYASANTYRFSTKPHDVETTLGYWGYRWRGSERWLSRDPAEEDGGLNLVEYCVGNPTALFDSLGLFPADDADEIFRGQVGPMPKYGCCGPDITHQFRRMRRDLDRRFRSLTPRRQMGICQSMIHKDGWDIGDLHLWGFGGSKPSRFDRYQRAGCGTDDCAGTVQLNGQCYPAGQVNYYLWGHAFALCRESMHRWTTTVFVPERSGETVVPRPQVFDLNGKRLTFTFSCAEANVKAFPWIMLKDILIKGLGAQAPCKAEWIAAGCRGTPVPSACAVAYCGKECCDIEYRDGLGGHLGFGDDNFNFGGLPWPPVME